ncbi:MAG: S8 family serine peptidase [Myxococcota bacterium]|nr:S8 family serine peptidase [Myxococcota bacterium]
MSVILLMATMVAVEPVWFHPGRGTEIVVIEADSTVNGVRVARTGELLARVEDPAALRALLQVAEVEVLAGDGHVVRIVPRPGIDDVVLSRELRARDDVVWSHPNLRVELVPTALPDDPFVTDQWHLENTGQGGWTPGVDIDAEIAWELSTGAGGMVAIIDTGVDTDHADLDVISGWDYIDNDDDPNPDFSTESGKHGTASAGLAAAVGDNGLGVAGVAYDSSVYAIRLIGGDTDLDDIYDAFVDATNAGAWVLSNSWSFGEDCPEIPLYGVLEDALVHAEEEGRDGRGAVVVLSAGNGNCDISNDLFQGYPTAISVAATNGNDDREGYSSFGEHVDVAGPAGGVLTTDLTGEPGYGDWDGDPDYYGYFSGTSAAAPVVSGVLALMIGANPELTAAQARDVLRQTAKRIDIENAGYDEDGWSPYYGFGRVDAGAAVLAVANQLPDEPPVVLGPAGEAWVDRVWLRWEPATDPDGDWLGYELAWWKGEQPSTVAIQQADDTRFDLTGLVAPGESVSFWVRATDAWGAGPQSEITTFVVREYEPPEDGGCGGGSDTTLAVFPLLALFVLRIRARLAPRT